MKVKMLQSVILLCSLSSLVLGDTGRPSFVSSYGQNKTASVGDNIVLDCSAINLSPDAHVEWVFLDHKVTLSQDQHILTQDPRLAIIQPQGGDPQWNLQITNVQHDDVGSYECRLTLGTDIYSQVSQLHIRDPLVIPTPAPGTFRPHNFTGCCAANGVTGSCLSVCDPSTFNFDGWDYVPCKAQMNAIISCGVGDRNHVPCCRRRYIPNFCLRFCHGSAGEVTESDYFCLDNLSRMTMCYEEGQYLLPSPPTRLIVEAVGPHQLQVRWSYPKENMASVESYRIFYKTDEASLYQSTSLLTLGNMRHLLENLEASTHYSVYITALNRYGSSLPTSITQIFTHSVNVPPGMDKDTFADCCKSRRIKPQCQARLCKEPDATTPAQDVIECYTEMDKLIICMGGELNHTACCQRQGVPSRCQSLCAGKMIGTPIDKLDCLTYMPDIAVCLDEGSGKIPGSPRQVYVEGITSRLATVHWSPPDKQAALVTEYKLYLWSNQHSNVLQLSTQATYLVLTDLQPATLYSAEVVAIGNLSLSSPSPTLVFMTYPVVMPTPPTTRIPVVDNLQACCSAAEVSSNCMQYCNFNAEFDKMTSETFLKCQSSLTSILKCATGGRNNTRCCTSRQLPTKCLDLCSYDPVVTPSLTGDHVQCLPHLTSITQCMSVGLANIPAPPEKIFADEVTAKIIKIMWAPSAVKGTSGVQGYVVRWRQVGLVNTYTEEMTTSTMHILQDLLPVTEYEVRLVAYNDHGWSLPAPVLIVRTLPEHMPLNITLAKNVSGCCQAEHVQDECMSGCAGTSVINLQQCSQDLGSIIHCAADGRDHTPCCNNNNVPEYCWKFCAGQPSANSFTTLLCLVFTEQIMSCFREGHYLLPSPPTHLYPKRIEPHFIVLEWDPPVSNAEHIIYKLIYHLGDYLEPSPIDYIYKQNVTPPYVLSSLQPMMMYNLFVVAENPHGASLPTPRLSVQTLSEELPEIEIIQKPPGKANMTINVTLECKVTDYSAVKPEIEWRRNLQVFNKSKILVYNITDQDEGRYTCVVSVGSRSASKSHYLHVQFAPEIEAKPERLEVPPNRYQGALLECHIRGHPDTIQWFKDGHQIHNEDHGNNRYLWLRVLHPDTGLVVSQLHVRDVKSGDYGMFTCQAKNSFGTHHGTIFLSNPEAEPGQPNVTPAPNVLNVTACCKQEKLKPACMGACTFDIDPNFIFKNPEDNCIEEVPKMVRCAADARNHTLCCEKQKVPSVCFSFCDGSIESPLQANHTQCLMYVTTIVSCMEEGHDNIPGQPKNVRGKLSQGYIKVWWDPPTVNRFKVSYYDIHYIHNEEKLIHTVMSDKTEVLLKAVHSNTVYSVYVESRNHHGHSLPSDALSITTQEMSPSAPMNLHGHILDDVDVSMRWDPPSQWPGAVTGYIIYYSPKGLDQFSKHATSVPDTHYTLTGLMPLTDYNIYITSKSSHFESDQSNTIIIPTGAPEALPVHDNSKVGVAVAVVVVVFILAVAGGGFAFWWFRMRKVPHQRFDEAVAFENPGYAKGGPGEAQAKVSGLPGDSSYSDTLEQQPSNGASIMHEVDNISDQGYSTLARTAERNGNHGYATLSISSVASPLDSSGVKLGLDESSSL